MNKYEKHKKICDELNDIYIKKNKDYGDSFGKTFREEGFASARIRLGDKLNRFSRLSRGHEQNVKDESIRDTLIDLANYAIMTVIEMEQDDFCTMTSCFYNDDLCHCNCSDDLRDGSKLEDCPSYIED